MASRTIFSQWQEFHLLYHIVQICSSLIPEEESLFLHFHLQINYILTICHLCIC
ncbi:hypothetical protein X975_02995, partial [Stegodyphus mimosarum]